ncbi:MAG TPA: DinB family protein [Cyclobacteriaceae bacterium]|nr:DinB family protein [Cyclobacteriaceae bacterium]
MNAYFLPIYNELERQRIDMLNHVKDLPAEKLNFAPPGKWSINQILTHLLVAEQLSMVYMKKKSLGIDQLGNSGLIAAIRIGLLKISQRIPAIKFKAPKVVLDHTPEALSLLELTEKWEAHRQKLRIFLEGIEEKNKKKLIYKHIIAGRLDAKQAMVFFREHSNHHWPQIKRLLHQD